MKKRFTDEQVIAILRESEAGATPIKALCKKHNISEQTFFRWRNRFGGMDVPDAKRLRRLPGLTRLIGRTGAQPVIDGRGHQPLIGSAACASAPAVKASAALPALRGWVRARKSRPRRSSAPPSVRSAKSAA